MAHNSRSRRLVTQLQETVPPEEKHALKDADDHAGIPLTAWMREHLRWAATRKLEVAALQIALLEKI